METRIYIPKDSNGRPNTNLPFSAKESYYTANFHQVHGWGCMGPNSVHIVDSKVLGLDLGDIVVKQHGDSFYVAGILAGRKKNVTGDADYLFVKEFNYKKAKELDKLLA